MGAGKVLVLGATGTIGRRVVRQLRERRVEVAAASRFGEVFFDWTDASTWDRALVGCRSLFVMAPDGVAVDPRFVRRAVEQGVSRLVLLSSKGIEVMGDQRLLAAEQTVRVAGPPWTIVRADWFNQNFDEGVLRDAVMSGEVAIPLGDMRQAFNDADDVAAVAVTTLTEPGHEGRVYELSGPDALTFHQAVEIIAEVSGRTIRYLGGAHDYLRVMTGLGRDREEVLHEVATFEALRADGDALVDDTVERVTGRPPKSFHTYAAEAAARGAWGTVRGL